MTAIYLHIIQAIKYYKLHKQLGFKIQVVKSFMTWQYFQVAQLKSSNILGCNLKIHKFIKTVFYFIGYKLDGTIYSFSGIKKLMSDLALEKTVVSCFTFVHKPFF